MEIERNSPINAAFHPIGRMETFFHRVQWGVQRSQTGVYWSATLLGLDREAEREIRLADQKGMAEIRVTKVGPNGIPMAEILVDKGFNVTQLGALVQKVTRDKDLLKKVGLRGCGACKSGLDINIRDRFQEVIQVDLKEIGGE
jgi:hypothetical protein